MLDYIKPLSPCLNLWCLLPYPLLNHTHPFCSHLRLFNTYYTEATFFNPLVAIMGTGSKVASVFLRVLELSSAAIVAGLVGQYLHYVSNAHDAANSRFVYTVTLAGISIVVSLVCMIPLNYAFYGFLLDAALFVMWMTAFGLLVNVSFISISLSLM